MSDQFLAGDRVNWFRMNRGLVSSTQIPAEVAWRTAKGLIAIKVIGKDGAATYRYVPPENLERIKDVSAL